MATKEIDRYMKLEELASFLPKEQEVIALAYRGEGLLEAYGFTGMIHGFWGDCVKGEIVRYLRRAGKAKGDNYVNTIYDFYIDSRCGKAPRKQIRELQEELKLAINEDFKPCCLCRKPTDTTAQGQHKWRTEEYKKKENKELGWKLSEKKLHNRGITKDSYVCYSCYQDKLATIPKS